MAQQESGMTYEQFLRMLRDGGWISFPVYRLLYGGNLIFKQRLATAIDDGKINFKITDNSEEYKEYPVNELKYRSDRKQPVRTYKEKDHIRREHIIAYLTYPTRESLRLILEAETFLLWLKDNYPLKNENTTPSQPDNSDTALSPKRENNLLKIIGGFVQTVYLQKDTGAYRNGDKPNISAVADTFQDELSKAGYSDKGFQNSSLRKIITDALEQIEENKNF
jgi:hypothetical protein